MLTAAPGEHDQEEIEKLGKLAAFSGVCEFPGRVKCATLAWHTLDAALEDGKKSISTVYIFDVRSLLSTIAGKSFCGSPRTGRS